MVFSFSGRTVQDSVSELVKNTNTKTNTLEHWCLIVAVLGIPVGRKNIKNESVTQTRYQCILLQLCNNFGKSIAEKTMCGTMRKNEREGNFT